jgi:hypothetical protein
MALQTTGLYRVATGDTGRATLGANPSLISNHLRVVLPTSPQLATLGGPHFEMQ